MAVNACPADEVNAPAEVVWSLMSEARALDSWWDATVQEPPEGLLQKGQRLIAKASEGPITATVTLDVEEVDPIRHRIIFDARFPLGIRDRAVMTATPRGAERCLLQFG